MAKAARKKSPGRPKKAGRPAKHAKKAAPKKAAPKKKSASKGGGAKSRNKLGVKNSLVNNINARKKKGVSRPKSKSKISKKSYKDMQTGW